MRTFYMSGLVALVSIVILGCQNKAAPMSQAMTPPPRAVVVSGGNGGSATVFIPSEDPASPTILCTSGDTVCPECKAAAIKYFSTGVLDPKCSRTGASRTVVTWVQSGSGHN